MDPVGEKGHPLAHKRATMIDVRMTSRMGLTERAADGPWEWPMEEVEAELRGAA